MNTTEINAAINAAIAPATVEIPAGTHEIVASSGSNAIVLKSGVTLRGAGRDATTLIAAPGSETRVVSVDGTTDAGIADMTLDGNRLTQTTGVHVISSGSGATRLKVQRVKVKSGRGYNIGMQGGAFVGCLFEDIISEDSASDAIDFKNLLNENTGNILRQWDVINFCQDPANSQKAGLDLRGTNFVVEDITVRSVAFSNAAIRLRQTDGFGYIGADDAVLRRCDITGDGAASGTGVYIAALRARVYNVTCRDLRHGAQIIKDDALMQDCDFSDACDTGVQVSAVSALVGNTATLRRVAAGPGGFEIAGSVTGTRLFQCTGPVDIAAGVTTTTIVGHGQTITDAATGTVAYAGTDASLMTELNGVGLYPLSAQLEADSSQRVLAIARFAHREGIGDMYYEIAPAAALSTLAAPMAAAANALR